ncbi:hypothetical protein Tco_1192531 [Tanacetum coccineum]
MTFRGGVTSNITSDIQTLMSKLLDRLLNFNEEHYLNLLIVQVGSSFLYIGGMMMEYTFAVKLDFIVPIFPGITEDDVDKERRLVIDIDIFQIEDEILREKLLNVNLLIDKIEALNLIPSTPFVLEYPSSSPIPVVDSDFLIEEFDTFLVPIDSNTSCIIEVI